MAIAQHAEIVALGREPIRADAPAGDPCRYEESFERLQAQLDRLGSLTGEEVDWRQVVELATGLLKTKSKDLLVITYLTLGLFETQGYDGLAAGLESYGEFVKNFWEKCYPKVKPPQGRYNAVQYLGDRILPLVELKGGQCKKNPTAGDKEAVHQCAALLTALDQAVSAAFAPLGETPNLLPLVRAFKALQEKVGAIGAPEPAAAPATATAGPAPAAATTAPGVPTAPATFATVAQAEDLVLKVARYLLTQDNKDARAYRLSRAVHFGGLTSAPKDGLLPPVPPQRRQFFENLASGGDWPQLLTEAEGQYFTTPLWLDLQRYVGTALKNLGAAYAAAHQAVVLETLSLRTRLPEVFELTFKDRTPFADGGTKAWVAERQGEFGGGGGAGAGAAGATDGLAKAVRQARKLLSESKPAEAVAHLAAAGDSLAGGRQRFQAQVALGRLLIDMNRLNLATPLLEQLEAQVVARHLDEWEPELAADVFAGLYDCLRRTKPKPTPDEAVRQAQVFGRLCQTDPSAALKLDGAASKA